MQTYFLHYYANTSTTCYTEWLEEQNLIVPQFWNVKSTITVWKELIPFLTFIPYIAPGLVDLKKIFDFRCINLASPCLYDINTVCMSVSNSSYIGGAVYHWLVWHFVSVTKFICNDSSPREITFRGIRN